MTINIIGCV